MNTETHSFETWYVYSFHAEKEKKTFLLFCCSLFFGNSRRLNEFLFKEECHISFGDYFIFFHPLSCSDDGNIRRDEMRWWRKDKNLCLFHSHLRRISIFISPELNMIFPHTILFIFDNKMIDLSFFRYLWYLQFYFFLYWTSKTRLLHLNSGLFYFLHSC